VLARCTSVLPAAQAVLDREFAAGSREGETIAHTL
jgi:hypothetical protein